MTARVQLICLAALLVGCEPPHKTDKVSVFDAPVMDVEGPRFEVRRHGKFRAGFEDNVRELLVVTDTKSGREFLCVTDCSVVELVAKQRREEAQQAVLDAALDALSNE